MSLLPAQLKPRAPAGPCLAEGAPQPERWDGYTPYDVALTRMEAAHAAVLAGGPEHIFLCEHPPLLTLGSSANPAHAEGAHGLAVMASSRGGQVTYHGPGQRVIYPIVRLDARWNADVRVYMRWLQGWVQAACAGLGVPTEVRGGAELGLWHQQAKLAAFGVRVRKGVTLHGAALNVSNDLEIYRRFVPCGLQGCAVTRLQEFRPDLDLAATDAALKSALVACWPRRAPLA